MRNYLAGICLNTQEAGTEDRPTNLYSYQLVNVLVTYQTLAYYVNEWLKTFFMQWYRDVESHDI